MVIVQREDFDVGAHLQAVTVRASGAGAVVSFVGLVREITGHDEPIRAMTLEHYPGMTENMLRAVEEEARQRWPLSASLVIHRYGELRPGDRIVLVACASPHRQAAFDACSFLIDWLKTKAPFWKQEFAADSARWVEARAADDEAAARWERAPSTAD